VQCYRLDKILDQFGVKAIDYMSVDTEGSELDALASYAFERVPARIIGIEVLIGPGREGRVEKTLEFMDQRGYQLRHKYTVAVRSPTLMALPSLLLISLLACLPWPCLALPRTLEFMDQRGTSSDTSTLLRYALHALPLWHGLLLLSLGHAEMTYILAWPCLAPTQVHCCGMFLTPWWHYLFFSLQVS